jgi:predicted Fe-Mo cluster-binding NifX family protein
MGGVDRTERHVIVATALAPDGTIGQAWGKADIIAVARVADGQLLDWQEHRVGWGRSHDQGTHGSHHARVVTFLREHGVEMVLAHHVGDGMRRMLGSMGVVLLEEAGGDARSAMVAAVTGGSRT